MSTRVKISMKDFPARIRELEKRLPHAVERGMREGALMLRGALVQAQIAKTKPQPVNVGQYKASWRWREVPGGAQVYNFSKQALFIELGRQPGKAPPLSPIREWVRRKGLWRGRFTELKAEAKRERDRTQRKRREERLARHRQQAGLRYAKTVLGGIDHGKERAKATGRRATRLGPKKPRGYRRTTFAWSNVKNAGRRALPSWEGMRRAAEKKAAREKVVGDMRERAVTDVALLVQRKIAKKGTPEKRVLRGAVQALQPKMPGILRRALREVKP